MYFFRKALSRVRLRITKIQKMPRKICLLYRIYKNKPPYLYNLIPDRVKFYSNWSSQIDNIFNIKTGSNFFRNTFFSSTITEWNKLDRDIRNSNSLNVFKACVCYFSPNDIPSKTEKWILFHLKSSYHSRDIQIFVIFSLPFHNFQVQKDRWKWNDLWCHKLDWVRKKKRSWLFQGFKAQGSFKISYF